MERIVIAKVVFILKEISNCLHQVTLLTKCRDDQIMAEYIKRLVDDLESYVDSEE